MRFQRALLLCFGVGVVWVLAAACGSPKPNDDTCVSTGGACVTNANECGESLPFPCNVGVCCVRIDAGSSDN